ncbi:MULTISPECIES: hypothetical protein [Corynebacterium]|uniref:DoxX family protein n=1 Tax=Corynebacterium TaxID=1716 RepID=UPI000C07B935|nr:MULTISPECIES: hypothetical protein [Corynebacterium]MBF0581640.1 hypothetical protein [Corynebacterium sp. ED61]
MKKQNGDAIRRAIWAGVFGFAGVMHFAQPKPFDTLVPPELPGGRRVWTYGSGAVELALGAAIAGSLTGRMSRSYEAAVSTTATAFLAGVWPGNIKMAWDWRNKGLTERSIAFVRVPLQLPMMYSTWKLGH